MLALVGMCRTDVQVLENLGWVSSVSPVETNIVIFTVKPGVDTAAVTADLKESSVLISSMGPGVLRLVTHLDVADGEIDRASAALRALRL